MEEKKQDEEIVKILEKWGMKTSWDQVVLEEHIELAKIEVNGELHATPLRRRLKQISALTGKSEDEIMDNTTGDEFGHLITACQFIDEEPETLFEEKKTFFIGDVEYGYRKPGALDTGEYISLEVTIADANRKKTSALPGILAVLIRPVVRTQDTEFGEMIDVEKFSAKTFPMRVAKFKKELRVPFFIHALSRITTGENGIKKVAESFMSKGSTTKQGRK